MRSTSIITLVFASGLLLSGCSHQSNTSVVTLPQTATGSTGSETDVDAPNEGTPTNTDSLEIAQFTGAILETNLTASGTIVMGNIEETHRLMIFSDYDCTYCRRFTTSDLPWILNVIATKGGLSIERIFVPMSAAGERAARLALCAAEQKKFSEADRWLSTKSISAIDIEKFAKGMGVNLKKLLACTAKNDLLAGHREKAKEYGIERVPSFVLGSDSWLGLLPKEQLREKLEAAVR